MRLRPPPVRLQLDAVHPAPLLHEPSARVYVSVVRSSLANAAALISLTCASSAFMRSAEGEQSLLARVGVQPQDELVKGLKRCGKIVRGEG